ncbi:type VI secretion system-associated protein TagF [Pseudomonas gingeri NCPPB 3146 = LMG 5327]|uniref:Type VI secretion system-associated protein TagF n=2 Tax=Pseudomonas gingeri TaxID=117681 RepID=A0A7Y8CDT3_9PSED|nr:MULTISPECIES: type VI secretion system-associated protein TagF [Pseudomonas]NVZ28952.1 type VI secretion system-associated protein TagF [Pseudomonas gingeri]NVZ63221.1 type VI secretion system-associated protein TagF [Pseudomonas gingeri]NVZ79539.1 type VI secretion system-associated protein TagF [Pseudomonas gingeri]NWA07247.1 type VI secretion system-associated protein TagF [Pseudomonas gingeri]NWC14291.1 type VI secretion system-associated protein TagF [Pseudomonas gingeri]
MTTVGFYGKLASRGDFVSRGLPQGFVQPWDAWLASGLLASQQQLGSDWLNVYLVSPLWRFVLAPGVCGPEAIAGVLMPSIDRVGRYFPLTIAQPLDAGHALATVVGGADDWFEQAEALLLATLEEEAGFEAFDQGVQDLGALLFANKPPTCDFAGLQRFAALDAQSRGLALAEQACVGASLWWGRGSQRIAAGLMRCTGLPATADFGSFLLGSGVSN